ncbi:MAG: glycerol-3-phosphate dehydrogenase/oxidase [Bacteroidales bacterium]|nr:glycerol-3-phosphate dehydrogenase/oxidase [Bacteroidales bacterium]
MKREDLILQLSDQDKIWDFIIIGGGGTGAGVALDAASRGYSVALFEKSDFAKATSSRSTKLVHGGVRYMQQGDIALVMEALHERGLLYRNAPHLVKKQPFLIPCFRWWESAFYGIGLTFYDLLSGRLSMGRSMVHKASTSLKKVPGLRKAGLFAGVKYYDGQFDDSRLIVNLAESAVEKGACILNYMRVVSLLKENGRIFGVLVRNEENGTEYKVKARVVVNATGVFADEILMMDAPEAKPKVRPSQGVHLVIDKSFLQGDCAIMIPKTDDGRVLFAVPWHDRVVVGTTDTLREIPEMEPAALEQEIEFILNTAGRYLTRAPKRSDVLSVFAGLRPLAAPEGEGKKTKEISRSHKLLVSPSKLVTIIGGKLTTYRRMAQDTVNKAIQLNLVEDRKCVTEHLPIHGYKKNPDLSDPYYVFGSDAESLHRLSASSEEFGRRLHPAFAYRVGDVVWVVRNEMARTVEDVLARRFRILFLDARTAMEMAPQVASVIAKERGLDDRWCEEQVAEFKKIASNYILS